MTRNRTVEVPIAEQTWHWIIVVWRGGAFYLLPPFVFLISTRQFFLLSYYFWLFGPSGLDSLLLWVLCSLRWVAEESAAMAAEPTEEAISSFISFTNSTREQALSLLKVSRPMFSPWNDSNSNKLFAIGERS